MYDVISVVNHFFFFFEKYCGGYMGYILDEIYDCDPQLGVIMAIPTGKSIVSIGIRTL